MASPPLISVKGPRWTGDERRQVCASPEKARAHSVGLREQLRAPGADRGDDLGLDRGGVDRVPDLVGAVEGEEVEADQQVEGLGRVRVAGDAGVVGLDPTGADDVVVQLRGARLEDGTVLWAEVRHPHPLPLPPVRIMAQAK